MENSSTYKGVDLQKATMYDIATLFPDYAPILIDPEGDITPEQERILELYTYAENYEIEDLKKQLEELFKKELLAILS